MKRIFSKFKTVSSLYLNRSALFSVLSSFSHNKWKKVLHNGYSFYIHTPNALCRYRAKSFSYKEPETLEWIDSMTNSSVLWDIGSNIGLYSVYAAYNASFVVAFEPMLENLVELKRNIVKNNLSRKVCLVPLGLSCHSGILWMSSLTEQIGRAFNHLDSFPSHNTLSYQTVAGDEKIVESLPNPTHIKIDVDGNELSVLKSIQGVLSHATSICIELDFSNSEELNNVVDFMSSHGFNMNKKQRSKFLSWGLDQTYNTFWTRPL